MIENISIGHRSIDCANQERTLDFYAALTGWQKGEAYGCPALVGNLCSTRRHGTFISRQHLTG